MYHNSASSLVGDVHQWMNEIAAVVTSHQAGPQLREWAWDNQPGKKTLLSFTPVRHCPALSSDPSWKDVLRRLTWVHLVNVMSMSLSNQVLRRLTCEPCIFQSRWTRLEIRIEESNMCTSLWTHFTCKRTESECLGVSSLIFRACFSKNTHVEVSSER